MVLQEHNRGLTIRQI